jgi:hypothetical protein
MNAPKDVIRRLCAVYNYRWPKQYITGVLFYDGYRITIEEFNEQAKLFRS